MTMLHKVANDRLASSSLREVAKNGHAAQPMPSWWQCAILSLGCMSGCTTWDQLGHTAAQPFRATGEFMARTGDQIGDLFERNPGRCQTPANVPSYQGQNHAMAKATALEAPSGVKPAAAQSATASPTISKPAASQAIHNTPSNPEKPRESQSVPAAPPAVELLPAPPGSPTSATMPSNPRSTAGTSTQPVSSSRTVAPAAATDSSANLANTTWCRVRVRNVGQQPAKAVGVTIASPANASLVSKDGDTVSAPTTGKMEFAPIAQVGPNEEVILVVGVASTDERANRLRVQVRDGLGGSNQDVQSRWQVAIEAVQ